MDKDKTNEATRTAWLTKNTKQNSRVRLKAPNEPRHAAYLESLAPEVLDWTRLRKPLVGRVVEREGARCRAFALAAEGAAAVPGAPDELVLSDLDFRGLDGCELRPLPQTRVSKALAQRAAYLTEANAPARLARLRDMQGAFDPLRDHLRPLHTSPLEGARGEMADFKDWGYLTRFSPFLQSRNALVTNGIYTRIGKRVRSVLCAAPMPDTNGSFDALWTSLCCHMLTVVPRNYGFADPERQLAMSTALLDEAARLSIPGLEDEDLIHFAQDYYRRNICVALGVHEDGVKAFIRSYEAGVRTFRLYTIATDVRLRHQVMRLTEEILKRTRIDDPIEFFVGQLTSLEQYEDLHASVSTTQWAAIDGFYIGNGGGVRCKTAETGMIVNTPALILGLRGRDGMKGKSIIIEGGIGDEPAMALLFGASGLSHAAAIAGASIEAPNGGLFIYDGHDYWALQRGEASDSGKIIETAAWPSSDLLYDDGDARQVEGETGFMRQDPRFVSMCGLVRMRNEWLAQCFVKLGVRNMRQLHALGAALTRAELAAAFAMEWVDIEAFGDVCALPNEAGADRYLIPLPVRRRTEAMRATALSIGGPVPARA